MIPGGVGIYQRDHHTLELLSRFDFVVAMGNVRSANSTVTALLSRGRKVFLTVGGAERIDAWSPANWPLTLGRLVEQAVRMRCHGIVADGEGGWANAPSGVAEAFGRAMATAGRAANLSMGFTSYPTWVKRSAFARGAGNGVWGSPQIYGKATYQDALRMPEGGRRLLHSWVEDWREKFPGGVVPSISAWPHAEGPALSTIEGYVRYLADVPAAGGVIGWTATSSPDWMLQKLRNYQPGGSAAGTTLQQAIEQLSNPGGLIDQVARSFEGLIEPSRSGGQAGELIAPVAIVIAAVLLAVVVGLAIWIVRR